MGIKKQLSEAGGWIIALVAFILVILVLWFASFNTIRDQHYKEAYICRTLIEESQTTGLDIVKLKFYIRNNCIDVQEAIK